MQDGNIQLPSAIPLFPLTGSLLLPQIKLPLRVFEPRYMRMVEDAIAGDELIGLVQPRKPSPEDNLGIVAEGHERPELYAVGCLGRITETTHRPDGQIGIVLNGLVRFRIEDEERSDGSYRRAVVDYAEFLRDLHTDPVDLDLARLLAAARKLATLQDFDFDLDLLTSLPAVVLVNALSTALPFAPAEKQALLEASTVAAREELLFHLMMMGLKEPAAGEGSESAWVH